MELNLRVINRQGQTSERQVKLSLRGGGITVGRGLTNDLCLEDSERVVSSSHARLEARDGCVWITDLSRNGTYLNDAPDPIPANQSVALCNGDRLGIGPYEILVSLGPDIASARHLAFDIHSDTHGGDLSGLAHVGAATDILDLLDPGGGRHAGMGLVRDPPHASNLPDDLFADAAPLDGQLSGPAPEAVPRGAPHRHTPVENVFYRPAERQGVPENYDLLNDAWDDPGAESAPTPAEPAPAAPVALAPQPAGERTDVMPALQESLQEAEPAVVTPPRRPEPPRPKAFQTSSSSGGELQAFLAGLGAGEPSQVEDSEVLLRRSGELLRALATGLIQTMMVRAQFKSELRLGVTTIRAAENNPFKFSIDANDILDRLLFRPSPGFLPPVTAAREAFEDIQAHEMAMTAGLRAALRALFARFEPSALEARLGDKSGLDQVLPMARKAKYWDLFTAAYDQVAADAAEDFMQLFEDAFARAYQEQIERLRAARGARRD